MTAAFGSVGGEASGLPSITPSMKILTPVGVNETRVRVALADRLELFDDFRKHLDRGLRLGELFEQRRAHAKRHLAALLEPLIEGEILWRYNGILKRRNAGFREELCDLGCDRVEIPHLELRGGIREVDRGFGQVTVGLARLVYADQLPDRTQRSTAGSLRSAPTVSPAGFCARASAALLTAVWCPSFPNKTIGCWVETASRAARMLG